MSRHNKLASALSGLKQQTETKAGPVETKAPAAVGAKSKSPEYIGTTVYLRRSTLAKTKSAILLSETKGAADVSELIETLLSEWLETQRPER